MLPETDEIRRLFLKRDGSVRLNHGGYGLAPEPVMTKRFELLQEQEDQPDVWFGMNLVKYYTEAVTAACKFVGADTDDLCVIDNATTGTNCILKSFRYGPESTILLTSHTFQGVKNTAQEIEEFNGFKRAFIHLSFPIRNEDEIIQLYEKEFVNNKDIKVAVIDHITSSSAVVMPVKKLILLCQKYNIISVIDGAHAPGQIQLDMKELGADFYVGNFHKWVYTARPCAFLWVSPKHHGTVRPLITSNSLQSFHDRFGDLGTRDFSPFYTLPTALKFYHDIGGLKSITDYAEGLLSWALPMLCDSLGTKPLPIPKHMRAPCMAIFELPPWPKDMRPIPAEKLVVEFWKKYSIQIHSVEFDYKQWMRLSANVYNTKDDYLRLRDALMDLFQIGQK